MNERSTKYIKKELLLITKFHLNKIRNILINGKVAVIILVGFNSSSFHSNETGVVVILEALVKS